MKSVRCLPKITPKEEEKEKGNIIDKNHYQNKYSILVTKIEKITFI